jgi:hypothetical protein
VAEALGMLRSAMGYLAAADATTLAAETQAQCLRDLAEVFGGIYTLSRPRLRLTAEAEPAAISAIAI